MGILGDVVRILDVVLALDSLLHPRNGRILVGAYIHDVVVALVLHGAALVVCLNRCIAILEVVAWSSLVAKAPYHYRRTVDGGVHHLHIACNMGVAELLDVRCRLLAIVVFVALDVGLVLQVDAILVAQVVPVRRIGVVAVAHVVDVAALHKEHLFLHLLARYVVASLRIVLVAVYTLHLDRLSVEIVVASGKSKLVLVGRSVLNLNLAEAHNGRECLDDVALFVLQFAHKSISVRSLSAPRLNDVAGMQGYVGSKAAVLFYLAHGCCCANAWYKRVLV